MKFKLDPVLEPRKYKIEYSKKSKSYKIYANRETQKVIAQILAGEKCFVESHKSWRIRQPSSMNFSDFAYQEIDNRALKILQQKQENFLLQGVGTLPEQTKIDADAKKEEEFAEEYGQKYKLNHIRIWKDDERAAGPYFCKVHGDIYSSNKIDDLVNLVQGEYLLQIKKPTALNIKPHFVFGIFDAIKQSFFDSDKSFTSYVYKNNELIRKKDYKTLIKDVDQFRVILDGADDLGHVFGSVGMGSAQTGSMIEGLLIFPLFIRGVAEGLESFSEEIHDQSVLFARKPFILADLKLELQQYRQNLCGLVGIDYQQTINDSPNELMKKISAQLHKIKNSAQNPNEFNNKLNEIAKVTEQYYALASKKIETPKEKAIIFAYCGWWSMVSMIGAMSAYEAQAIFNLVDRGIEGITFSNDPEDLTLMTQIGMGFGIGGQALMLAYAAYKTTEQGMKLQEVKKKIIEFKESGNVSEFARKISEDILQGKKSFHQKQCYGHAALALGQSLMLVGNATGFGGIKMEPLSWTGLGITLLSVGVNAFSEWQYKKAYEINEKYDEVERSIITKAPNFMAADYNNINSVVLEHVQHQSFALEILGHLRAPQFVLYEKYIENNRDDAGMISKALSVVGAGDIAKWLNKPPSHSIDLVKDNSFIAEFANDKNNYDLDIFSVKKDDFKFIWDISAVLAKLQKLKDKSSEEIAAGIAVISDEVNRIRKEKFGDILNIKYDNSRKIDDIHKELVSVIQQDFIFYKAQKNKDKSSIKDICSKIINNGGDGALYLKRKLLRAVANDNLQYESGAQIDGINIYKNGKKVPVAEFDIEKFEEKSLEEFLTKRRPKKGLVNKVLSAEKKSVFTKTYDEDSFRVKSDHLRPFSAIVDLNVGTKNFLEEIKDEEEKELEQEQAKRIELPPENKIVKPQIDWEKQNAILNNLNGLVKDKTEHKKQNEILDELSKQKNFILREEIEDVELSRTFFIYDDPDFVGDVRYQIVYSRDDADGTINVFYGQKVHALLLQQAKDESNAAVVEIDKGEINKYGEQKDFSEFSKIDQELKNQITKARQKPRTVIHKSEVKHMNSNKEVEKNNALAG